MSGLIYIIFLSETKLVPKKIMRNQIKSTV